MLMQTLIRDIQTGLGIHRISTAIVSAQCCTSSSARCCCLYVDAKQQPLAFRLLWILTGLVQQPLLNVERKRTSAFFSNLGAAHSLSTVARRNHVRCNAAGLLLRVAGLARVLELAVWSTTGELAALHKQ